MPKLFPQEAAVCTIRKQMKTQVHVGLGTRVITWLWVMPWATEFLISSSGLCFFSPVPWCGPALNFSIQPQSTIQVLPQSLPPQHLPRWCVLPAPACLSEVLRGGRQGQVWNRFEREMHLKKPENCCAEVWISSWIPFYILQSCLHSSDAQGKMRIFIF